MQTHLFLALIAAVVVLASIAPLGGPAVITMLAAIAVAWLRPLTDGQFRGGDRR